MAEMDTVEIANRQDAATAGSIKAGYCLYNFHETIIYPPRPKSAMVFSWLRINSGHPISRNTSCRITIRNNAMAIVPHQVSGIGLTRNKGFCIAI